MPWVDGAGNKALLVIDVQRDFCAGGALAVPGAEQIVPLINSLARQFNHMILTQDWHCTGHASFASSHRGKKPLDEIWLAYGRQTLWPDHCIQGTAGADFHPALDTIAANWCCGKGIIARSTRIPRSSRMIATRRPG